MAIIEKKAIISPEAEQPFDNLIKQYDILIAKNKELVSSSANLQKAFVQVSQAQTSDGTEAKKLVEINDKLIKNNTQLTAVEKERAKVEKQLIDSAAKLEATEQKSLVELQKNRLELQKRNIAAKEAAKIELQLVGAYDRESKKLNELRRAYKNAALEGSKTNKELKAQLKTIQQLDKKLKDLDDSVGQNQRSVGKYRDALKGLGTQILGAAGITVGITGLIEAGKAFVEQANKIVDATNKIRQTFKLSKQDATDLAVEVNAIADTFDVDYNEVITAANTVSKELGISVQEATQQIQDGFLKGSNNSGQFLDILKEYPAQFKAAGIDASTMFGIINQQVTEGIYSDKGVDAIKEGGLRLRENTKAVQEALAPLDDFTKAQIKQEIAAGNSFKAIQLVSKALSDNSLTAEQTQKIIADVFGGAGEDAGLRYLQTLKDINTNLDEVAGQANESKESTLRLNLEWNKFVGKFTDSDGIFAKVWSTLKNLLAGAIAGVTVLLDLLDKRYAKELKGVKELTVTRQAGQRNYEEEIEYQNKILEGVGKTTKKVKELTEAEKELIKVKFERLKIAEENKSLETLGVVAETKGIEDELQKIKLQSQQETFDKLNENLRAEQKRQYDEEIARIQEIEDAKKEIRESAIDAGVDYAKNAANIIAEDSLSKEKNKIEAEKDLLKDQLDKGLISEVAYNQKIAELNKRERLAEAKAERKKALYDIAINTAVAAVKALPNLLKVASTIAIGAIQAASVAARPLPKFAKGEINIKGKSHSEGGVIAEIEGGESVITKTGTANAPQALEMINKGLLTDEQIMVKKPDYSGMIYKQLNKLNRTNEQLLQANENAVWEYEDNGVKYIVFATGRKKVKFG